MMTPSRRELVVQQKLDADELNYLALLMHAPLRFQRIESPVTHLEDVLKQQWCSPYLREAGGQSLRQRVVEFAGTVVEEGYGDVRMAISIGDTPLLVLKDLSLAAACLVFDLGEGVMRQGWMNGDNPQTDMTHDVPAGMKIVCQPCVKKMYEDWVGTGAPATVVSSATDSQRERALLQDIMLVRPFMPPRPLASAATNP